MIGNKTMTAVLWFVVVMVGEAYQRAWAERPGTPAVAGTAGMGQDFTKISDAIDCELDRRLAEAKVPASPCADDAEFLRRVTIDIVGRIPTRQEATAFLASTDGQKRRKRIDELLASQQYGQHFQDIWRGLIEPRTDSGSRSPKDQFSPWLAAQFNRNWGWNEIVYAMLAAEGDLSQVPETGFIMVPSANSQPQPNQLATATTRLFLGVRLQCAECHNGALRPVSGDQQRVIGQTDHHALPKGFAHWTLDEVASVFIDDVEDVLQWLAKRLFLIPSRQALSGRVHKRDARIGVGGDNRIADAGQCRCKPLPLAGDLDFGGAALSNVFDGQQD